MSEVQEQAKLGAFLCFIAEEFFWCPQKWEKFNGREKFCRSENTLHEPREKDNQFNKLFP